MAVKLFGVHNTGAFASYSGPVVSGYEKYGRGGYFKTMEGTPVNLAFGASKGRTGGITNIGSDSQTWGQPIPVTWGKVKISGVMLQILPVRQQIVELRTFAYKKGSKILVWGADYGTYFYTDFAIGLGYSGDPTVRKIINRVWIDGQLVYQESGGAGQQAQFAFYPQSETAPVADQISSGTIDPVAYRGLNYLVLINMVLNSPGYLRKTMPRVDVEFFDYAISSTPRATFSPIIPATPGPGVNDLTQFYDWEAALLYTVDNTDTIHKWSVTQGREVDQYPITNKPGTWSGVGVSSASTAYVKVNGKRYITAEQNNGSNSDHIVVINLDTGVCTDVFGLSTTGGGTILNDYGGDRIANQFAHLPMVTGIAGSQKAYVLMSTLGGGEYLWRISDDGKLVYLGHDNAYPRPKMASPEGIVDSGTGESYFIVSREPSSGGAETTEILAIDTSGRAIYKGTAITASGLTLLAAFATADKCFVLFETNGATSQIRKIDPKTGNVVRSLTGGAAPNLPTVGTGSQPWRMSNTQGRTIGWLSISGNTFYKLDMLSMSITSWTLSPTPTTSGYQPAYDAIDNKFYDASGTFVAGITVAPLDTARTALSTVLTGMCVRAGYLSGDVVVENITDLITGAILPASFNLRETLNDLAAVYNFKIIERDGKIVLTRRARGASFGAADWIVEEKDRCVLDSDEDANITLLTRRRTDSNVPSRVSLTYIDEAYNYEASTYRYQRPDGTTSSTGTAEYSVPIVMTQSEAAALAARMTYDGYTGRMEHEFRLPQQFLAMEPGDTINLYRTGFIDLVEVIELTVNGDFTIDVKAVSITSTDAPTYTSGEMTTPTVEQPVIFGDGRSDLIVIDPPAILPSHAFTDTRSPVYYAVVSASRGAWPGGSVYFAVNTAEPYGLLGSVVVEAVTGKCLTTLTDTNWLGIDRTSAGDITIRFTTGDKTRLETVATLDMLEGKNRILIGAPGRWEIIGFETVTQNADGTTTLSGTARGMRGTDVYMGLHTSLDTAVYLDAQANEPFTHFSDISLDGDLVTVKAGYDDTVIRMQQPVKYTSNKNGRKPLAVMNPRAVLAGGNDITLTWSRRNRTGGSFIDSSGITALDETAETYDLEIYSGVTLKRTVSGLTSPTYTYTSANQTTDGFTPPLTSLKVVIYQVSSVAGRGFDRSVTLDVE